MLQVIVSEEAVEGSDRKVEGDEEEFRFGKIPGVPYWERTEEGIEKRGKVEIGEWGQGEEASHGLFEL